MVPTRRRALGILAAAAPLLANRAAGSPAAPEAPSESPPDDGASPPAEIATGRNRYDHVLLPVSVNQAGPYNFIVDTGANISCISQDLAARLALPPGRPSRVHTVTGARNRPSVIVQSLGIGPKIRRDVRMPALPISGVNADGVLGVDWLKGQRLELAFKQRRLEIAPSQREPAAEGRVTVPAKRRWGQLTMIDADASGERISAMVDSGSQLTLCNTAFQQMLVAAERRRGREEPRVTVGLATIAGERFDGQLTYVPFLRLGGLLLGNVPVVHTDSPVFALWDLIDRPALLLGLDLLTQFDRVALDYGRSAVTFDISPVSPAARKAASSSRTRTHIAAAFSRKNNAA